MAYDAFLKLDGIEGESTQKGHENEIEVFSFSWGLLVPAVNVQSGGGGGAGKVSFQDIHFTSSVHKGSTQLFLKCATGEHIKTGVLTVRKAGGTDRAFDYLKLQLTDLLVSSYQPAFAVSDESPSEEVSLNFAKIEFDYQIQNADGSVSILSEAIFDINANRAG
jgi:type VI secretion system secreted protein Hcp